jgi:hypothetical protein
MESVTPEVPRDGGGAGRLVRRKWPIVVTVAVLVTGMAYGLWWPTVVRHHDYWLYSGDIWSAYRSAHYIGWGAFGSVYAVGTGVITFPGILLLLAPMAMVTGALGMTESFPYYVPHPTAWLALGPYEMLIGCSALFACDALAERLGVSRGRRALLSVAQGVALWPMLAFWGHPEDALGLALGVYALVLALDDRWTGAGWLFGAAVATQPLVILMLPVLLAMAGRPRVAALLARVTLPAVVLLVTPIVTQFHATVHELVDQPNFPRIDHVTPWTALAPKLGGTGTGVMVAAGPGRILAVLAACVLGWWARRWRDRPEALVWAVAAALALRCLTESVLVPYYLWPPLAVGLVLACTSRPRMLFAIAGAVAVTVSAEIRFEQWAWWASVTAGTMIVLFAGLPPTRSSRVPDEVPIPLNAPAVGPMPDHSRGLAGATR